MNRNFLFYIIILLLFGSLIWIVIEEGKSVFSQNSPAAIEKADSSKPTENAPPITSTVADDASSIVEYIKSKLEHPISLLILQIMIIIGVSRLFGFLFGKIGQPTVIGEIIAGILLGPSLLGLYFPETFSFIFPASSMGNLEIVSQIGLVLFMFIIGMELDLKILKLRAKTALIISHTSILFAFFLGTILAYFLFSSYAPKDTDFASFALFIGIAMSIAAFPVLARIIQERGMTKTPFGKMIITIAAIDDLTAWCILAVVIAVIQAGSILNALATVFLVILFIIFMLFGMQPLLQRISSIYITREMLSKRVVAFVFFLVFLSAYFTEIIGIKALFGGFIAGVIMPSNAQFKKVMAEKIEDISLVVLLPLFFVFTGLRTHIGLLSENDAWTTCCLIILFAVAGKFGGSFIAAKVNKLSWKDSFIIGTLMNTRGLMELIVLNIGYDLGILSPQVFTMMVIMTLVTTFMTGPVLSITDFFTRKKKVVTEFPELPGMHILITFGLPKMGDSLLRLAYLLTGKEKTHQKFNALHLTPHTEVTQSDAIKYETNNFAPARAVANDLKIELKTIYKTTEDVTKEIIRTVKKEKPNLLLMGAAKSIFNSNILGGRVKNIIDQTQCNMGIFIDKGFHKSNNILVLSDNVCFEKFVNISERILLNSESRITFALSEGAANSELPDFLRNESRIYLSRTFILDSISFRHFDLLITDINYFERKLRDNTMLLDTAPSLLLMEFKDNIFLTKQ